MYIYIYIYTYISLYIRERERDIIVIVSLSPPSHGVVFSEMSAGGRSPSSGLFSSEMLVQLPSKETSTPSK